MLSIKSKKSKPLKPAVQLSAPLSVCTFYHYHPIKKSKLSKLKKNWINSKPALHIRGLILLSSEGINATLTGPAPYLKDYILLIQNQTKIPIEARWQNSRLWGFKKLRIKIKNEIVQTGQRGLSTPSENSHLMPDEWKKAIQSPNAVVLDVRNNYEVQVGRFKNAKHLSLKKFKDFPAQLKKASLSKNLIF